MKLVSRLLVFVVLFWVGLGVAAADVPLPELTRRIVDQADLLPPAEEAALESELANYEQSTGHQFALLTLTTLEGQPLEDFSIRVAEKWKVGDAKRDDGLILIVVRDDRLVRIEVGYGLEGAVPDAVAARVIRNQLTPRFREGNYSGGIADAFHALMKAAEGEAIGEAPPEKSGGKGLYLLFKILPIAIFLLLYFLGGGGGGRMRYAGALGGFAAGGGFGGGRGSFGGGGFGGGGGGFGGGGASGRW